jgi:Tfp pilus assembly protein PilN
MITTNLATRPFYNERIVRLWLLVALALVVAATVFNVTRIIRYSHSDTELGTQAARDEERASELRAQAARQRASVDPKQLEFASNEAQQANELIDRRTFSWTELFNWFETTLPDNVRITAVRPKTDRGQFIISIAVIARGADDVSQFMDNLERTRAFSQVGSHLDEHFNEQGQLETSLEVIYTPDSGRALPGVRR